jgi:hypothetical protein
MKIKKIFCSTILLSIILSSTQAYAKSTSINVNAYSGGWYGAMGSIIKYYTGQHYYMDDIIAASYTIPYEDAGSWDTDLMESYGFNGMYYPSIISFSSIQTEIKAGRPIEAIVDCKKTDLSRYFVIFSCTESNNNNYIGYIDSMDGKRYTMKYSSFCDNSNFTWKTTIYTGGDEVSNNKSHNIDINYNNTEDVGVDNVKDISIKNIYNFKEAIIAQKSYYGLESSDDFDNITLGSPREYYSISIPFLNENSDTINAESLINEGYIFPLKLNDKNIGTAYVKYSEGKWQVDSISNSNLEDMITSAKEKNNLENVKLIIDESVKTFGLLCPDSNNNYFVSFYDINVGAGLKKDIKVETKNLLKYIKNYFTFK